jgi:methylated-DNA-[protein]-cysteine S-methyltransferase
MNNNSKLDLNKEDKNGSTNTIKDSDVYDLLLKIPEGYVSTYGDLARALGSPSASRLIGRILGNNPNPIKVPCHRVVKSDGKLGGYRYGIDKKKDLLEKEGISITNRTIIDNFENIRFYHQYFNNKKSD